MKKNTSFQYFHKNISYLRAKNRLSQKKMAKILKIDVATLRTIEDGKIPLRRDWA